MGNFCNPFETGINYDMFLKALGTKTVKIYCKGKLTEDQIEWLIEDLKHYKLNKNK